MLKDAIPPLTQRSYFFLSGHGHTPVHDTAHAPGQSPHFHLTGPTGERGNKNTPHVNYPQKNSCMPSPKSQRKNQNQ
jgi:hypothetical protein